ncbi:hypothetical protein EG339_21030 [Chryseobacterium bernardetii]|uniref:CHAT domain-containing protein n=1 Tax=Chryseobacterium bernardetii TaxID=1241978 RepID=A0A3G6TLE4_9FLAO|nr:hypothetical protein [Chryseobacterium bernardetii]AZB26890.1 hypothetical protein EG339_21030 [Chryseobacterium bernardetii]
MNIIKVQDFNRKLTDERLHNHNRYQNELTTLYREIISGMATDYFEYRNHIPAFLHSLEQNSDHSLPYSIDLFLELYNKLLGSKNFNLFDLSIMDHKPDDHTIKMMEPILEASYKKKKEQRLSENNFDISTISDQNKKKMATLVIRKFQNDAKQLNWDEGLVISNISLAGFLRQILLALNNPELFYHSVGLIVDRLSSSEYYQPGRDFAEEVILSSYKDGIPEAGYFNSFRIYSNIGSIHASLIYINLALTCLLEKKPPYSVRLTREIIWQSFKFFRNVKFYEFAIELYTEIPAEINFPAYERRSLDHGYFTVLLMMHDQSLPSKLLDYLRTERENILAGGINDATPWLLTLYNIKRTYPSADFSASGFGFFLSTFEMIVPPENVKKYKDIIHADSEDLKKHLKESLVKLNETRNTADFVYDNKTAIMISERLIDYSTKKENAAAFLLSMVLKSDYSILFQEKKSAELVPLILPEINVDELETLYDNTEEFKKELSLSTGIAMCWLASAEEQLSELQLFNDVFSFHLLKDWNHSIYKQLLDSDYFVDLEFNDTVKESRSIRQVYPEEYENEEIRMIKQLSIGKLSIHNMAQGLYIVNDMELARFPHNLFLNGVGDFIAKHIPVTNVLSTEWLLEKKGTKPLHFDYRKSIWIPIESGDIPLSYLYGNIENTLQEFSFVVHQEIQLQTPLSAEINIVCSHGAKNISDTQMISQGGNFTYDLNTIIGKGKILIFFVCHSASMKTEFFRNNVTSLIKRFIAQGYDAVIAPCWALDVTVPKYWLPEFLKSFEEGQTVSEAMFNANKKVYERYPTPAAWACLHLYGNPNLKRDIN